MKSALDTRHILDKLEGQHPGADTELHHTNAFQLLVATILSAQSTDQGVNQVTPALFKRYRNARALARATPEELEPQIHSTGFFRAKSRSLIGMAQALVAEHGGEVPASMEALVKLPGVGRKTANVVLGHALGVPGLPVDRHVLRVSNRIGIAHRRIRKSEQQLGAAAARALDAHLGHVDSARPPHLPAQAALRPVRRAGRLRVLRDAEGARAAAGTARACRGQRPRADPATDGEEMKRADFERLVQEALGTIPRRFRQAIKNLAIVVEDEPGAQLLREMDIEPPDTLLGLYQGILLTDRHSGLRQRPARPHSLFQGPLERESSDEDDLVVAIGETLIHEVGHYFGLSEEEIQAIEDHTGTRDA